MGESLWELAYVLPNLNLSECFQCSQMALVPAKDPRVQQIEEAIPSARKLLHAFVDMTGQAIEPAVLLIHPEAPASAVTAEALVAFRNMVALSIQLREWAHVRKQGQPEHPLFSDSFDFYPVTMADQDHLVILSPALQAIVTLEAPFQGMAAPHVPRFYHQRYGLDFILYEGLRLHWERRFAENNEERETRVIFRSLEMAYHASSVPLKNQANLFDYGLYLSIWVSAMEILVHPKKRTASQEQVLRLLGSFSWNDSRLNQEKFEIVLNREYQYVNLIQKLYKEIYRARGYFLHGNPVKEESLYPFGNTKYPDLWSLAPLVYRTALLAYLQELHPHFAVVWPSEVWELAQLEYEDALLQLIQT
ncbi:hypothetical protein [Rubeoparvulum massiliense]|uniref:hypothetical protein n=1 Tax=Rubeoparvulum massiliense TaxID=1631346 RepID=UPI00065DE5D3|nr:hypothetical protein [Rubeoparvulum massiliense]